MTIVVDSKPTVIFVDGNCIVCDFEMNHYKKIAPNDFQMVDISDPGFDALTHGLTPAAVHRHMHVQTPDGQVVTGVEAFAHIWSRIPKYRMASRLILLPGMNLVARLGYEAFARIRPWLPKKKRR